MDELGSLAELLWMLVWNPKTGVLLALLAAAAVSDLRSLRIPNALTVAGMVYALLLALSTGGGSALASAAGGLAVGLLVLLPLYVVRVVGAGDVKLMAMVGAFVGPVAVLGAVLFSGVAGGVLALAWAAWRGALLRVASNLWFVAIGLLSPAAAGGRPYQSLKASSVGKVPFGIGICVGTAAWLVARQLA